MYKVTIENYNEDTNKLEYLSWVVYEGDILLTPEGDKIVTVADSDHAIICAYDSENGTDADNEEWLSDRWVQAYGTFLGAE